MSYFRAVRLVERQLRPVECGVLPVSVEKVLDDGTLVVRIRGKRYHLYLTALPEGPDDALAQFTVVVHTALQRFAGRASKKAAQRDGLLADFLKYLGGV